MQTTPGPDQLRPRPRSPPADDLVPSTLPARGPLRLFCLRTLASSTADGLSACQVSRIKERVEEKEGIPPAQQRLIFGGKQMHDDKTAREFGVEGGSVLHVSVL